MKTKIAIACLGLFSATFALDEYMPIGKGMWEFDGGYSLTSGSGAYDKNGDKQSAVGSPLTHGVPLQVKYGVAQGMDLELYLPVTSQNDDAGGKTGVDRPELALKYTQKDWVFGLFLNAILPVGLSDFSSNPAPGAALSAGGVYDNMLTDDFHLVSLASYQYSIASGDNKNPDVLTLLAKPEMLWNSQTGTYLGLKVNMYTKSKFNGAELDNAGYLVTLLPGVNYKLDKAISYEINLPVTVLGKNQGASLGLWASLYYSI